MEELVNLDTINISNNVLTSISGLSNLKKLKTLIVSGNNITNSDGIAGLLECPSISCLDLQRNKIVDTSITDILFRLPNLSVLYLQVFFIIKIGKRSSQENKKLQEVIYRKNTYTQVLRRQTSICRG